MRIASLRWLHPLAVEGGRVMSCTVKNGEKAIMHVVSGRDRDLETGGGAVSWHSMLMYTQVPSKRLM